MSSNNHKLKAELRFIITPEQKETLLPQIVLDLIASIPDEVIFDYIMVREELE